MPRTPPLGLLRAVRRAKARAATTSDGTSALAKQVPAYASSSKPFASCSSTCRCSARMPDRPGALPRLLVRKAAARASGVMRGKASGVNAITSLGMWSRGSGGRRSGSVSASQVASVRSWRARETSPLQTRAQAACMRRSSSASPPATACEFAALPRAARNKASQSPRWKATTLSKSACLPSGPFLPNARKQHARGQYKKLPSPCAGGGVAGPRRVMGGTDLAQGLHQRSTQRRAQKTRHILQSGDRMTELRREINIIERTGLALGGEAGEPSVTEAVSLCTPGASARGLARAPRRLRRPAR